jgi:hypothetical protein
MNAVAIDICVIVACPPASDKHYVIYRSACSVARWRLRGWRRFRARVVTRPHSAPEPLQVLLYCAATPAGRNTGRATCHQRTCKNRRVLHASEAGVIAGEHTRRRHAACFAAFSACVTPGAAASTAPPAFYDKARAIKGRRCRGTRAAPPQRRATTQRRRWFFSACAYGVASSPPLARHASFRHRSDAAAKRERVT